MVNKLKKYLPYIVVVILYIFSNILQVSFLRSCGGGLLTQSAPLPPANVTVIQRDTTIRIPTTVIVKEKLIPQIEIDTRYITDSTAIKSLLLQRDSLLKELHYKGVKSTVTLDTILQTNDTLHAWYEEVQRNFGVIFKPSPRTVSIRDVIVTQTVQPNWGIGITTGIGAGYGVTGINAGAYAVIGIQYHLINF